MKVEVIQAKTCNQSVKAFLYDYKQLSVPLRSARCIPYYSQSLMCESIESGNIGHNSAIAR